MSYNVFFRIKEDLEKKRSKPQKGSVAHGEKSRRTQDFSKESAKQEPPSPGSAGVTNGLVKFKTPLRENAGNSFTNLLLVVFYIHICLRNMYIY